jgi:DNA polymerase III subunit delta
MSSEKPVVYILRGDDELAIHQYIKAMMNKMGDRSTAELNTTQLDGRSASNTDLRGATMAIPFLADRRLVILTHPLVGTSSKTPDDRFLELLDVLPPTTALVLQVEDRGRNKKTGDGSWEFVWERLPKKHWLMKWAGQAGGRAMVKDFALPRQANMKDWIMKTARELDGQFTPQAAAVLAEQVGTNTRLASQEILKLLTYVDFKRPVELDEVQDLAIPGGQVNIFDMVDAVAIRNSRKALSELHRLQEYQDANSLFPMIIRQFRMLLQMREILDEDGKISEGSSELKRSPPFVINKLKDQARRFSIIELEQIYRRLLSMDEAIKTSQMSASLVLDVFIAELDTPHRQK